MCALHSHSHPYVSLWSSRPWRSCDCEEQRESPNNRGVNMIISSAQECSRMPADIPLLSCSKVCIPARWNQGWWWRITPAPGWVRGGASSLNEKQSRLPESVVLWSAMSDWSRNKLIYSMRSLRLHLVSWLKEKDVLLWAAIVCKICTKKLISSKLQHKGQEHGSEEGT